METMKPFILCNLDLFFNVFAWVHVFVSGQQYSKEFGDISIVRKVPVMKDGSFILTERYSRGLSFGLAFLHIISMI